MPFGLTGAPSTFAHVTADKLGDLLASLELELFVDDGGMAGDEFEEMLGHTVVFLECVHATRMSLSGKKSMFFTTEMVFAGSKVRPDSVQADNTKLTVVVDWRQPPDLLNLSSFLSLTSYFRDLVKGYAKMAQPLSDLLCSVAIPKDAGKATYRAALRRVKLPDLWTSEHQSAFLRFKKALTSEPVLKAPRFDGTPFVVTMDGCKDGFGAVLAHRFREMRPGGRVVEKLHPIAFASKCTSKAEEWFKPFLLEFAALKFGLDKFDNVIWGFPVEVKTDCQALRDILLSTDLSTTHARWRDGVMAHQIVGVQHIPGRINIVADGLSRQGEDQEHTEEDGNRWSVTPDWEEARGLEYDLFTVEIPATSEHEALRNRFNSERDRKCAKHRAEGYFVEGGKLWRLGGPSPTRAVARRECVTKLKATQLARKEHAKLHMGQDIIKTQLLDRICSPLLDASITRAIMECARCKNFGGVHVHSLLSPITRRKPLELLCGNYLSMPVGKGGFTKIGLYADVFSRKLFVFKSKSAKGSNTIDSLCR